MTPHFTQLSKTIAASHHWFSPSCSPVNSVLNIYLQMVHISHTHHNQLVGPSILCAHLDHCSNFLAIYHLSLSPNPDCSLFMSLPSTGFSLQLKSKFHTMIYKHTNPTGTLTPSDSWSQSYTSPISFPFFNPTKLVFTSRPLYLFFHRLGCSFPCIFV